MTPLGDEAPTLLGSVAPVGDEAGDWMSLMSKWFEDALNAERQEMEMRHCLLLQEYRQHHRPVFELAARTPYAQADDETLKQSLSLPVMESTVRHPELESVEISRELEAQTNSCFEPGPEAQKQQNGEVKLQNTQPKSLGPIPAESSDLCLSESSADPGPPRPSSSILFEEDDVDFEGEMWIEKLVLNNRFEVAFSMLIVLNTVVMALESQYKGYGVGRNLNYPNYNSTSTEAWPGMDAVFLVLGWFFGIMFTIELVLKVAAMRRAIIHDLWIWFDGIIVFGWLLGAAASDFVTLPVDPMILRLARLARLLRLLKLAKSIHGFDPLFLMITTLRGSMPVMMWVFVLLSSCQTIFALLLNQVLTSFFLELEGGDEATKHLVFEYFGTFTRAMLTMFEMTLGNWVPVARLLLDGVSEWFMILSLMHKLSMGFAVVGVINGIFIKETFKVAASDDTLMLIEKQRAHSIHRTKMQEFFDAADKNHDRIVDFKEFKKILQKDHVKLWLSAQELDASDPEKLFRLLDGNGNHLLTVGEMIEGVSRLKGGARTADLQDLVAHQKRLADSVSKILEQLSDIDKKVGQRPGPSARQVASPFSQILVL